MLERINLRARFPGVPVPRSIAFSIPRITRRSWAVASPSREAGSVHARCGGGAEHSRVRSGREAFACHVLLSSRCISWACQAKALRWQCRAVTFGSLPGDGGGAVRRFRHHRRAQIIATTPKAILRFVALAFISPCGRAWACSRWLWASASGFFLGDPSFEAGPAGVFGWSSSSSADPDPGHGGALILAGIFVCPPRRNRRHCRLSQKRV